MHVAEIKSVADVRVELSKVIDQETRPNAYIELKLYVLVEVSCTLMAAAATAAASMPNHCIRQCDATTTHETFYESYLIIGSIVSTGRKGY